MRVAIVIVMDAHIVSLHVHIYVHQYINTSIHTRTVRGKRQDVRARVEERLDDGHLPLCVIVCHW